MIPPPPIKLENLLAGTKLIAGLGHSTVLADIDFETYSPAGYVWSPHQNKFVAPRGAKTKGLQTVGVAVYTEHPEAEVLSLAYNLKDGRGERLWLPTLENPEDLFAHIRGGNKIEAWNATFEFWVWNSICVRRYGWPQLLMSQIRCAAAKARAFSLPGSLANAGSVLGTQNQKNKDGIRLLQKFSMPRNPTKTDPRLRIKPEDDDTDFTNLLKYNIEDIRAEAELSSRIPDLSDTEQLFWQCDQDINHRGVQVDIETIGKAIEIIEKAYQKYNQELQQLTNAEVSSANEIQRIRQWIEKQGPRASVLDEDNVTQLLKLELPPSVRRVLEIRQLIGLASVKKLYAMTNQATTKGRLHDLFVYHSARTGRAAGSGPQPQNLPNSGPEIKVCTNIDCNQLSPGYFEDCRFCGISFRDNDAKNSKTADWNFTAVEAAITTIKTGSLDCVEFYWGDAIATVSGCLRGMFISAPGKDLICSDYASIEAVVLAALAGEQWQLDVFKQHGKIYEMTASKITGLSFEEIVNYETDHGQKHPQRRLGKVAALASGYGSWIGGWKAFGADEFLNDEQIKSAILAWRKANPNIVWMWGGQQCNWQTEYYGLEGAAIRAVLSPREQFSYGDIVYMVVDDVLYCKLPSGRYITYHRPRLEQSERRPGTYSLSYEGWNTNPKYGGIGWMRMNTYGGKLTENVVQATARDILAHAICKLEIANYSVVLHVHDEIVSEIPENWGSIEEFEKIMSTLPEWAKDWPIKARGGWRGKRYRK